MKNRIAKSFRIFDPIDLDCVRDSLPYLANPNELLKQVRIDGVLFSLDDFFLMKDIIYEKINGGASDCKNNGSSVSSNGKWCLCGICRWAFQNILELPKYTLPTGEKFGYHPSTAPLLDKMSHESVINLAINNLEYNHENEMIIYSTGTMYGIKSYKDLKPFEFIVKYCDLIKKYLDGENPSAPENLGKGTVHYTVITSNGKEVRIEIEKKDK